MCPLHVELKWFDFRSRFAGLDRIAKVQVEGCFGVRRDRVVTGSAEQHRADRVRRLAGFVARQR
jgi:hypothetical protein